MIDHLTSSLPGVVLGLSAFLALGAIGLRLYRAPVARHAWVERVLVAALVCAAALFAPIDRPLAAEVAPVPAPPAAHVGDVDGAAEPASSAPALSSAGSTDRLEATPVLASLLALGAALIALRLLVAGALLARTVRRGERLAALDGEPGIRVLASDRALRPFCAGTRRLGVSVLPRPLVSDRFEDERDAVLAHERAHLVAGHGRARLTAAAAAPLLFWNPIYWFLVARMRVDAELCADDAAAILVGRRRYARALLSLVERMPPHRAQPLLPVLGALAPTRSLLHRMESLMSRSQPLDTNPSTRSRGASIGLALAALALVNAACGAPGVRPATGPEGRTVLSFQTLDLEGTAIERALSDGVRTSAPFPARVAGLEGRRVTMEGYFIPLMFEDDRVSEFLLLRDNLACCMGGAPKWGHWVHARADGTSAAEYFGAGRVRVEGEFDLVHPNEWESMEFAEGVYQLRRWSVQPVDL
ncbi:MAG: M56 family metallopeptidase [Planctomycetota bacterium]